MKRTRLKSSSNVDIVLFSSQTHIHIHTEKESFANVFLTFQKNNLIPTSVLRNMVKHTTLVLLLSSQLWLYLVNLVVEDNISIFENFKLTEKL